MVAQTYFMRHIPDNLRFNGEVTIVKQSTLEGIEQAVVLQSKRQLSPDRRGRMTASAIHKLFTKAYKPSDAKTRYDYLFEIVAEDFGAHNEDWSSAATRWGHQHESDAVMLYMERTGLEVTKWGNEQEFVKYGDRAGATPDGIILPNGGLQVKCPYNPANHIQYMLCKKPSDLKAKYNEHYCQMQMEMLCTKSEWWDFVSFDPRFELQRQLHILRVSIDTEFQIRLKAELEACALEIERIKNDLLK